MFCYCLLHSRYVHSKYFDIRSKSERTSFDNVAYMLRTRAFHCIHGSNKYHLAPSTYVVILNVLYCITCRVIVHTAWRSGGFSGENYHNNIAHSIIIKTHRFLLNILVLLLLLSLRDVILRATALVCYTRLTRYATHTCATYSDENKNIHPIFVTRLK